MFAFSDVMPTIGLFDHNSSSVRLFDVKREQIMAHVDTNCKSIQPLYVDGMPQLVGVHSKTFKVGLLM